MKVLWFTNIPVLSSGLIGRKDRIGGWLESMAMEIRDHNNIELGISYYHNRKIKPFTSSGVTLYPVYNGLDKKINVRSRNLFNTDEGNDDPAVFMKIIDDFQPDIIHIHGTELAFGRIMDLTPVPVVFSIQGILTVCSHFFYRGVNPSEYKKYTSLKNKLKLSALHSKYSLFKKKAIREQEFLSKCRHIIGRTGWDKRVCSILAPCARYYHNDEILRSRFYENKWVVNRNEKFTIYTTTTDSVYKGLETIFETAILLNRKLNIDYIWKIGGLSLSDNYVKICLKKYRRDFPANNVIFSGPLDEASVIREMLNSDLYVMPSHIENSSNSLCEAMILGLPVISTFAGGTDSLLENGSEGILIQDGDPWSMAGAVAEMYSYPETSAGYGEKARKRALIRHDRKRNADELITIYSTVIS
jgi:glycosyltransferase involved in cell wall biosynthesis